ncbi:hypothetical protein SAMN02982917_5690 [Azospirillum oryzae]|uniref:Uncharacterized protein n=1 Tax=Azospirillum oryzae TaxID=286727 RepID=A0A1X7HCX7_9PROT|nr:hypothetical protein SAMN02982917_5690 [Azospirillum oryzae]
MARRPAPVAHYSDVTPELQRERAIYRAEIVHRPAMAAPSILHSNIGGHNWLMQPDSE